MKNMFLIIKRFSAVILVIAFALSMLSSAANAVSNWAYKEVTECVRVGLCDPDMAEGNTTLAVTQSEFQDIAERFADKIHAKTNEIPEKELYTRKDVLEIFYKTIGNSAYADEIGYSEEMSASDFMTENGIIKGSGNGTDLDSVCSLEMALIFSVRAASVYYDKVGEGSEGFLWRAAKRRTVVYLFGAELSAHSEIFPLSADVMEAFEGSTDLAVPANTSSREELEAFAKSAMYEDGTNLSDHISDELYIKVHSELKKHGFYKDAVDCFKPWFIALLIEGLNTYDDSGVETLNSYLISLASDSDMPITAIESLEEQAEVLNGFSSALQLYLLEKALEGGAAKQPKDLIDAWMSGDIALHGKLLSKYSMFTDDTLKAEYETAVNRSRAELYAKKIAEMINNGSSERKTYFTAIDADIASTVASMLTDHGITVKEYPYK